MLNHPLNNKLKFDPVSGEYQFDHMPISSKAYNAIREMASRNLDKIRIWIEDADGNIIQENVEAETIVMVDGGLPWGVCSWDSTNEDFGSADTGPCRHPFSHKFKREAYTTWYFRECVYCGYSPELDASKPEFERCHREFIEWEKQGGRLK